ncbi:MAG: FHA domain-containing protein [Deltaproteobacteria bacterium]|nr:FHA domain-containing protein [Deltaproteobacteria bacterium]
MNGINMGIIGKLRPARHGARLVGALLLLACIFWAGSGLAGWRQDAGPAGPAAATGSLEKKLPAEASLSAMVLHPLNPAGSALGGDAGMDAPLFDTGWALRGLAALLGLAAFLFTVSRPRQVNRINSPGFEIITPTESRRFIPLEEKFQAMDFIARMEKMESLRLSANLNKVSLSIRRYGYLLEDKNYRNALLVNRRRVRRTLLRDGDVLDMGDLTLLYRDKRQVPIVRHSSVTPPEGKVQLKFERLRGPVRKGLPMLVSEQFPNRIFYITKNKVYIGRSESCDLVIKAQDVQYNHAKIEKIGGRYKLHDLTLHGDTFVNNRRMEQRLLREGDEVAFENHKFTFQIVNKITRDMPNRARQPGQETRQAMGDDSSGYDGDESELELVEADE